MNTRAAGLVVTALLLPWAPASGWAAGSWLDAEIQAQEARWAAQQGQVAPRLPPTTAASRRPPRVQAKASPSATRPFRSVGKPDISPIILANAQRRRLDPLLVKAVILTESAGRSGARSPKGAMGLMQLMPATATRFGVIDPFDPVQNIIGGTRYLGWLLDRYDGNISLALAGYNAGEGQVDRYGGIPPYRETRDYVRRVQATHAALGRILAQKQARAAQKSDE